MALSFDFAVVGAGVFGSWTAHYLRSFGKVALLDAYGPANSRASSGGESRIIRMGYAADRLYSQWSARSLPRWTEFFDRAGRPLFHRTGVLWLAKKDDTHVSESLKSLNQLGLSAEHLSQAELRKRYPQFELSDVTWALLEPQSGVLMARQAIQALVNDLVRSGVEYIPDAVAPLAGAGNLTFITTRTGRNIHAGQFVFACGPWLPTFFPELIAGKLFITRQEVFFFGTPAGDAHFTPTAMPTWICIGDESYGMPDLESRGLKIAFDRHGPAFDPGTGSRVASAAGLEHIRQYLARRFPALKDAPVLETRVCQYENTWNGDFLIDRHPDFDNVWLAGGGSGHGFKHGPAVGEYVAGLILGHTEPEPRFTLETKRAMQHREVF